MATGAVCPFRRRTPNCAPRTTVRNNNPIRPNQPPGGGGARYVQSAVIWVFSSLMTNQPRSTRHYSPKTKPTKTHPATPTELDKSPDCAAWGVECDAPKRRPPYGYSCEYAHRYQRQIDTAPLISSCPQPPCAAYRLAGNPPIGT